MEEDNVSVKSVKNKLKGCVFVIVGLPGFAISIPLFMANIGSLGGFQMYRETKYSKVVVDIVCSWANIYHKGVELLFPE